MLYMQALNYCLRSFIKRHSPAESYLNVSGSYERYTCHTNKKTLFGNSHVTDDVITLDETWEDILRQMLSCRGLTVFYV